MSQATQSPTDDSDTIVDPEAFSKYADRLFASNNLFQCNKCGHYAGDPRNRNFLAMCPGCDRTVKFYRIIS